jgi:hypothetical protein
MPIGRFCGIFGLCDDLQQGAKNDTVQKARQSSHLDFPVANLAQRFYTLI